MNGLWWQIAQRWNRYQQLRSRTTRGYLTRADRDEYNRLGVEITLLIEQGCRGEVSEVHPVKESA